MTGRTACATVHTTGTTARAAAPRTGQAGEPERWVRAFVGLYLEVEAGLRPGRHLRPLLALDLQPVLGSCGRAGAVPDVLAVRVQSRPGVCEAAVLLRGRHRTSVLALAMRREDHGWQVTELRRPEDPPRTEVSEPELLPVIDEPLGEPPGEVRAPRWDVPSGWGPLQAPQGARAA